MAHTPLNQHMTISIHFDQRDYESNNSVNEEDTMSHPVETRQDAVVIVGMELVTLRDDATASMTEHSDDGSTSTSTSTSTPSDEEEDSLVLARRRVRPVYDDASFAEEDSLVLARRRGLRNWGKIGAAIGTSENIEEVEQPDYDMLLRSGSIAPETWDGLSSKPRRFNVRQSSEPLLRSVSRSRRTSASRLIRRSSTAGHRLQRTTRFPRLCTTDEIRSVKIFRE
jgi:hypothetical protein